VGQWVELAKVIQPSKISLMTLEICRNFLMEDVQEVQEVQEVQGVQSRCSGGSDVS
jgi:hypothetical protein